ncbi:MAG TPA: bifunctional GTP diphosphokinase/guanosine-3',5'-bis pyrophosphate 3'-pyrophosphohydrolase [Thioalkalivibrio sp.]|nr:bifunctional GTP diphosphokinase/guanosine-3',5'-bis pyrophosphate 3'-pyrophosphohydrolase [Thioalkalivibrio sp.]
MAESAPSGFLSPQNPKDTTRFLVSDLCSILETYLDPDQISEVYRAYLFGAEAHEGQMRQSGEPYIYHPIAVAKTLAEMRMDHHSLMAAILHDVIEDTATAKEQLEREFGAEVAELVDGVSKLTHLHFESKAEAQAENFRKMMLAMVRDVRVMMVKLADRLHNMRTVGALRPDKRRRIARETLEIYAPIAQRLGMNAMRRELELLGFRAYWPLRYAILELAVQRARGHRKEVLHRIEASVVNRLEEAGVVARVIGREKNLYSIYKKMREKGVAFADVFDVYAIRMIVEDVDTCYRCLGIMHNLYKPVPGRFKDYIAIPKANGYQSLHTTLFGPHGIPLEIQIRTAEMDHVAESGIAAHWLYKSGDRHSATAQARAREWMKTVLEMQQSAGDSIEFLENIKVDLFPDEVYVFTPKGDIMELPRGATPVDFAYAVHSDVGNSCVAAKIDRQLAPLSTQLESGQAVEVITAPNARPNPAWLGFVVTGKARANIRHHLKSMKEDEAVALGRRLLEKALIPLGQSLDTVPEAQVQALLAEFGIADVERLFEDIGLGTRMAPLIARRLVGDEEPAAGGKRTPLAIRGTEGMVVSFAKCCYPIPGDPIVGVMSTGRGMVIHREGCRNVAEFRGQPDKWVPLEWSAEVDREFPASVRVQSENQRGVLATLASKIASMDANIENVAFEERDSTTTTITFLLSVRDRRHLARIIRSIRNTPAVMKIWRMRG